MTRLNATKHGILSDADVVDSVDGEGAHQIHTDLVMRTWQELAPVGVIEEELVSQLVDVLWRFRRLKRWETAVIQARAESLVNKRLPQPIPVQRLLDHCEVREESSAAEHGPHQTVDTGAETFSQHGRDLKLGLASLPSDPDLNTFLRYDTYLSNKFIKIVP